MSTDLLNVDAHGRLLEQLAAVVGADNLLTDDESRRFYSTDVYRQADVLAMAVARPGTVDELREVVKLCSGARCSMVARGGGASYTDGYLPVREKTVCVDTGRLKQISVNEQDMYVTAEAGVTWEELYIELKSRGLRTPFWGPFFRAGRNCWRFDVQLCCQLWFRALRRIRRIPDRSGYHTGEW